ncbi:MAG: flagellar hook-length control protein FliK [Hydrogenophaga sp.]|uniref:flagellar hook-length control protein FliK n=1 Tax=Hydrogenophaga sp. TaxID=1904254 RepID=UPI001DCD0D04|nr:flagellar hook-length control protein FliK [Hydrogenophaga sp.]MBX3609670.1 flagellar hook-length control protein FliK [Hydrogenophaga sp.]
MTTSATPSSSAPSHANAAGQARPAQANPHEKRQGPADLFSTLLALAADAAPVDGSEPGDTVLASTDAQDDDASAPTDNPLAALLMWQAPGLTKPTSDATPSDPTTVTKAGKDAKDVPATDAQALDLAHDEPRTDTPTAKAPDALANSTPATPVRGNSVSWQVAATRAAQTAAPGAAASATPRGVAGANDLPAMRWTRGAPSSDAAPVATSVRSTVTMDARFAQTTTSPHGAAMAARAQAMADEVRQGEELRPGEARHSALGAVSASSDGTSSGGLSGDLSGDLSGGMGSDSGGSQHGAGAHDDSNPSNDPYNANVNDPDSVDVQHWAGAHGLRHASLRVGEEAAQAIDIQLALRGDELRLDIRTDDAGTRDALREQAQAALGERLQQGGLQLGEVSVGAQQQQERQRDASVAQPAPTIRRGADESPAATPAPRAPAARSATSGGLDLFI